MKNASEQLIQDRIRDLRENTDFISTLFESLIGYAIVAVDFDGNIIAYNEGARLIYGYAPEEIIGKQNIEMFFPEDFIRGGNLQQITNDLIQKERYAYEGEKVRKNGEKFPAQILFTLTKDKSGKVVGFIEIVEDLTERKRVEEALRKGRDDLVERVKELNCLHVLSSLAEEPGILLEKIFQRIVNIIRTAWQYSSITCPRSVLFRRV